MKSCRIVTGPIDSGKTSYMLELIAKAPMARGFISSKDRSGYSLVDIESKEERRYLSINPIFEYRFGKWYIDYSSFDWAYKKLYHLDYGDVFLDEVGRLELEGKGFSKALSMLKEREINLTLAIRDEFVQSIINAFSLDDAIVVSVPPIVP